LILKKTVTTVLLLGYLGFAAPYPCRAEPIIQITTGEYPPWSSSHLKHEGLVNHVITEAFEREGYRATFVYFPWKRAYTAALKGDPFFVTSFWFQSEERAKHFYYSDPVMVEKTVFFHLKSKPIKKWSSLDDLKGYRIGATRGYTYTKEFWEAHQSGRLNIEMANSDELNFKKLLKERIDFFPTGLAAGLGILEEQFTPAMKKRVTYHPKPLLLGTGHLLVNKKHKDSKRIVQALNRGLSKLRQEGLIDAFMDDLLKGKYRN
jgi:polar amino acid transport system substrate-binding protein